MKILILGLNYAPEPVGIAVYTTGLAVALTKAGHEVSVVAGQPYYPAWKLMAGHRQLWQRSQQDGVDLVRCPHYIPANPTGPRRILHHLSFALAAFVPTLSRAVFQRPDVVFTIAPSLLATPVARLAAWAGGSSAWLHIQDFEIEASFATGLISDGGLPARLARRFENALLKAFDNVSAISPQMCAKLADKGIAADRIVEFRNWGDLDAVQPLADASPYRAQWGITTPHVALYAGNIANKQGINIVVQAARQLAHRTDLTFVVCGEGPNRQALEAQASDLTNIQFHNLQPRERINELLGLASVHLLPQLASAADLVLPSKLINMLASGRPVVATAAANTGLALELDGCGLTTEPGQPGSFAAAIERLLDSPDLYAETAKAARVRAEERWSEQRIIGHLLTRLKTLKRHIPPATGVESTPQ
ncbi:MAG: WcaI family glycosyltransferase [Devosia sp.]